MASWHIDSDNATPSQNKHFAHTNKATQVSFLLLIFKPKITPYQCMYSYLFVFSHSFDIWSSISKAALDYTVFSEEFQYTKSNETRFIAVLITVLQIQTADLVVLTLTSFVAMIILIALTLVWCFATGLRLFLIITFPKCSFTFKVLLSMVGSLMAQTPPKEKFLT